jgi:hypothetical protein
VFIASTFSDAPATRPPLSCGGLSLRLKPEGVPPEVRLRHHAPRDHVPLSTDRCRPLARLQSRNE